MSLAKEEVCILWEDGDIERMACGAVEGVGESYWGACHEKQIRAFYRALREGDTAPWTPQDARKTLEIVQAIYLSARIGDAVKI